VTELLCNVGVAVRNSANAPPPAIKNR